MRSLLCISATALVLAHATLSSAPVTLGSSAPCNTFDLSSVTRHLRTQQNDSSCLQDQLDAYIREGRFPKAGRSLEKKIDEANAFLERELGNSTLAGPGVTAAVVYNDKVVLSKGYGLRNVSDKSSRVTTSTLFQIGSVTKTFVALAIA
ncbi:Hypothetical protein PHPALM_37805, partial [Globisporangium polare]